MKKSKGIFIKISTLVIAVMLFTAFLVVFAQGGAKLEFVYPEGVTDEVVTISG